MSLASLFHLFYGRFVRSKRHASRDYWQARYNRGGTSGPGSEGRLRDWKAHYLNAFVERHNVRSVIEFGCGDGFQLEQAQYPSYIGLDVSSKAIQLCQERFATEKTKSFYGYTPNAFVDNHGLFRAEVALSLDVIFHLVEDWVFEQYMTHLFAGATRFVVIYSSDEERWDISPHVRHRKFSDWTTVHAAGWELVEQTSNQYRGQPGLGVVDANDFFVFARVDSPDATTVAAAPGRPHMLES